MNNAKNVGRYLFGNGALDRLSELLDGRSNSYVLFFVDHFFQNAPILDRLPVTQDDELIFVDTTDEPKTTDINRYRDMLKSKGKSAPYAIVAIGGGATLDTGKAVANLLTNEGDAEDYQGWDLVKVPAVYKIGIPTLSGTGAEASRTCVMTNPKNGLKLGMNSDFTIYDQLILDPELTATVPREQYFYTGMDTFIHCIESLNGRYRNAIGDAFSNQALTLIEEVFMSDDMMSEANREKLMVASYLGGCAIANSYVGVVHPFSAGLSVVLDTHHCIGNCITMNAMEAFYPEAYAQFIKMAKRQGIQVPTGIAADLTDEQYQALFNATVIHEKPLANALGDDFREVLTLAKVTEIFKRM